MKDYVMRSQVGADGYPKVVVNLGIEEPSTNLYSIHDIDDRPPPHKRCTHLAGQNMEIRINHYVRSLQHFAHKILRHYKEDKHYDHEPLNRFWGRDINLFYDDSIYERFGCQTKALMAHPPPPLEEGINIPKLTQVLRTSR